MDKEKRTKHTFYTDSYQFREGIQQIFEKDDLSMLHEESDKNWVSLANPRSSDFELLRDPRKDQETNYHKIFYKAFKEDGALNNIYLNFIEKEVRPKFNEKVLYQRIPSFRVHLPNNLGVGAFHRDREYGHSIHEINVYLPLTDARDSSTIWAETIEDLQDMSPMNAVYGEYYTWDGANLLHGNKVNDTGKTRVSLDFRLLKMSDYRLEQASKKSISNGTKMTVGEYWTNL